MGVFAKGQFGANFKRQFDLESYKKFFADMGVTSVDYFVVEGRMPCAIAVMGKQLGGTESILALI